MQKSQFLPLTAGDSGMLGTLCLCGFHVRCHYSRYLRIADCGPWYFPRYDFWRISPLRQLKRSQAIYHQWAATVNPFAVHDDTPRHAGILSKHRCKHSVRAHRERPASADKPFLPSPLPWSASARCGASVCHRRFQHFAHRHHFTFPEEMRTFEGYRFGSLRALNRGAISLGVVRGAACRVRYNRF